MDPKSEELGKVLRAAVEMYFSFEGGRVMDEEVAEINAVSDAETGREPPSSGRAGGKRVLFLTSDVVEELEKIAPEGMTWERVATYLLRVSVGLEVEELPHSAVPT